MRYLLLFFVGCGSDISVQPGGTSESTSALCDYSYIANWHWQKQGVVKGIPTGVLSPSLVNVAGTMHLYFAKKDGVQHRIWHAESQDGETFTNLQQVTGLGDSPVIAYPSVWREGSTFKLLYGSGSLNLASSQDGVNFTIDQAQVLSPSFDTTRFDTYSLLYPSRVGDVVYFSAFDGRTIRIGRAQSWVVSPTTPVLDLGDGFDNTAVAQPHVRHAYGKWLMWYGGYDTSVANPGPYRIGFAESTDGITWSKRGLSVANTLPTDAWSTRDPALVDQDGKWTMFYIGLGNDNVYRLHRATSTVCALGE